MMKMCTPVAIGYDVLHTFDCTEDMHTPQKTPTFSLARQWQSMEAIHTLLCIDNPMQGRRNLSIRPGIHTRILPLAFNPPLSMEDLLCDSSVDLCDVIEHTCSDTDGSTTYMWHSSAGQCDAVDSWRDSFSRAVGVA